MADGRIYKGHCKNDKRHGRRTLSFKNETKNQVLGEMVLEKDGLLHINAKMYINLLIFNYQLHFQYF